MKCEFLVIKFKDKFMKNVLFVFTIFLFCGCASSIKSKLVNKSYAQLSEDQKVLVLEDFAFLPENSELIGEIKIGDSGFTTDCSYDNVLATAISTAKKSGANIIQIVKLKTPDGFSTCYRIKAKIYRNLNNDLLVSFFEKRNLKSKSRLPIDADYAIVHFYRPRLFFGSALGYKLKDSSDSTIGRLRNGEKFIYKTDKFGEQSFYGSLETKEEIKINIEKGREYFVRCGVKMGVIIGRPEINLIENYIGINEFEKVK